MEKIANVQDSKRRKSLNFEYQGKQAILVHTKHGKLVAYRTACPHEGATIVWDAEIHKLVCECHLSLFNAEDGSVYKYSSIFEKMADLTPITLEIDDNQDIYAV